MTIPKGYCFSFKLSSCIDVYCTENANLKILENDILLSEDDYFWNCEQKRQATKDEIQKEIKSISKPMILDNEKAAALVRVLSGAKAKRIKAKVIQVKEEEEEKSEFSDSGEEEDDFEEDEEEFYEDD
jgi:hypothetical protein